MKFKKSVALMVSVIFVATSSMTFAEIGNNDTKAVSSVKTLEKMGKNEVTSLETVVVATEEAAVSTEEAVVATEEAVVATEEAVVATEEAAVATEEAAVATKEAAVATKEVVAATKEAVVATEEAAEIAIGEVVEIEEQPVALAEELKEEVLPESVVPAVVPEILPEVLPEIKKEATLKVVTSLNCNGEAITFERKVEGLFAGDVVNISDYVNENPDVMAINGEGTLELKEGENEIVINYEFRSSSNNVQDESLKSVDPMNC